MNRRRAILLASLLFPVTASAQKQDCGPKGAASVRKYTPAQLRQIGLEEMARFVQGFGRVSDTATRRVVTSVLPKLIKATGDPHLDVQWELVGDDEVNATALPGGVMIVNQGLVKEFRSLVAKEASTPAAREARLTGYLAAVLGHELGHITLGHSDSLANEELRCVTAKLRAKGRLLRDTLNTEETKELAYALSDTASLHAAARMRADESAADRVGALYMLRAGWQIQQAMDLFSQFDRFERANRDGSLGNLTWFTSHPRSSQREAQLEAFRAKLKMHQAEFDDALLLVQRSVALDSAVTMLDRVLVDFPDLAPARHARAAALHQMWMETTTPRALRVFSGAPVHDTSFSSTIRGEGVPGDRSLLDSARKEYRRVLAVTALPYALANLAVLDAYSGDTRSARARADSALKSAPRDPAVANNRAAVYFLTGDAKTARTEWTRLMKGWDDHRAVFNLAQANLALADTASAIENLALYLNGLDTSSWMAEGERQLTVLAPDRVKKKTTRRRTP